MCENIVCVCSLIDWRICVNETNIPFLICMGALICECSLEACVVYFNLRCFSLPHFVAPIVISLRVLHVKL